MKQFTKTKFFRLIEESSDRNVHPSVLENAYDEFAGTLFAESTETPDILVFHQALCYAQVELISIYSHSKGDSGKKILL
ncbi:MAG: hypothetical protein LBH90_07220 [Tannerella sp.]|jgi:hypothetical protein|nr:hypothetical protein [Tannerella sp.]